MGDARYYTMVQFGSIVWLTILIVVTVPALLNSFYKIEQYKWRICLAGLALVLALLCHYVSAIIHIEASISFYYMLRNIALLIYCGLAAFYYVESFAKEAEYQRKSATASLILFGAALVMLWLAPRAWPLAYAILVVQYLLLSNLLSSYSFGVNLFSDIKKMVLDYVVITDADGCLIYASERAFAADFFRLQDKMNLNDIASFFSGDVTMRQSFSKQFIRLRRQKTRFFQFHKKAITSQGRISGHILTFVDISELIAMLDEYELKRAAVFKSNVRLRRYKERVYQIEREKEVNHLLREIAENQEKSLAELNSKIGQLALDDPAFDSEIDGLIASAKASLSDVRQAVSTYKNYYREGE